MSVGTSALKSSSTLNTRPTCMQPRMMSIPPSQPLKMRCWTVCLSWSTWRLLRPGSLKSQMSSHLRGSVWWRGLSSSTTTLRSLVPTFDFTSTSHCSAFWILPSGMSHRPPSSLWKKSWLPTKATQLATWGSTSRTSRQMGIQIGCQGSWGWLHSRHGAIPGQDYAGGPQCPPETWTWCNQPNSLLPCQHHVILHHHSYLWGQVFHKPEDCAVPQR